MPLEEVIAGYTFQGFATTPPTIPGLQAMGIFGTTKDAINGNRAPGGPAFANLTNPPVIGSAWITVNNGTATSTPTQGIDTNCIETAAVVASGWTIWGVVRTAITTGNASLLSIGPGQAGGLILNPQNNTISNHPSAYLTWQGLSFTSPEQTLDLAGVSLAAWRMVAVSYPTGSGARPYRISDVTGATEKITTTTHSRTAVGVTNHFNFGNSSGTLPANIFQIGDIASGGVSFQPLTLAQLQTIRTWLLGILAVRGVTGF